MVDHANDPYQKSSGRFDWITASGAAEKAAFTARQRKELHFSILFFPIRSTAIRLPQLRLLIRPMITIAVT